MSSTCCEGASAPRPAARASGSAACAGMFGQARPRARSRSRAFTSPQEEAAKLVAGEELPGTEDESRMALACYARAMDHVGVMASDPQLPLARPRDPRPALRRLRFPARQKPRPVAGRSDRRDRRRWQPRLSRSRRGRGPRSHRRAGRLAPRGRPRRTGRRQSRDGPSEPGLDPSFPRRQRPHLPDRAVARAGARGPDVARVLLDRGVSRSTHTHLLCGPPSLARPLPAGARCHGLGRLLRRGASRAGAAAA